MGVYNVNSKPVLIYLHGFLSSPNSAKARATQDFMATHYPDIQMFVPEIDNYPEKAKEQLTRLVDEVKSTELRFIGSSMGGFLSTYLMQRVGGKGVLINPAVSPHVLLKTYLGQHVNPYTKQSFELTESHIGVLENMYTSVINEPQNIWALLKTGDETLDYREAEHLYRDANLTVIDGGDHSFADYDDYLPAIGRFLFEDTPPNMHR